MKKLLVLALTPIALAFFAQSALAQSAIETGFTATVTGPDGHGQRNGFGMSGEGVTATAVHVTTEATSATVRFQDRSRILALRRRTKVAGIALASAWGLTVLGSAAMGDDTLGTTALPIVGPWVSMARVGSDDDLDYLSGGKGLLVTSGVIQAGLLVYFIASYSNQNSFASGFTVSPVLNPIGSGISLGYRF